MVEHLLIGPCDLLTGELSRDTTLGWVGVTPSFAGKLREASLSGPGLQLCRIVTPSSLSKDSSSNHVVY